MPVQTVSDTGLFVCAGGGSMAALPYIQFYIAEYLADTAHLTTEEHGAYLLLIFNYWQRGKPLVDDNKRLASVVHLLNERWETVRTTLEEFFDIRDGYWYHPRIERDLKTVSDKHEKARKAGIASGKSRLLNRRSTDVEQTLNHKEKNKSKNKNNIKKKNKKKYFDFVFLTDEEYQKLKEVLNSQVDCYIQQLNDYIGSKGTRYKSHYHTILSWYRRDQKNTQSPDKSERDRKAAFYAGL